MNDLIVKNVDLFGDTVVAAQDKDGVIWAGVKWLCDGIGLSEGQVKAERLKIQEDLVLSKGGRNLTLPTNGGNQDTLCIQLNFIPLWLAKISITPNMKENNPELVDKLVKYQLQAKDVLAKAFLHAEYERKESLDAINRAADILREAYRAAGTDERYLALLAGSIYKEFGMDFALPPIKMDIDKLYDQTTIAAELGIMSTSGKPHSQAVGAIIDSLNIKDDDKITTPYTNHGHSGVVVQYKENVVDAVREWLVDNGYPRTIGKENKKYNVVYK